jgi:integrase
MRHAFRGVKKVDAIQKDGSTNTYYQIDYRVDGKRTRRYFDTEKDALKAHKEIETKVKNEGKDALSMSHALRVMAVQGERELLPFKKTIADAVAFYKAHLEETQKSITVTALIDEYMAMQKSRNKSPLHLKDLRLRFGRFGLKFGDRLVCDVKPKEIEAWLLSLNLPSPVSFNNYRARIGFLFGYGTKHGYLVRNPVDNRIEKMPVIEKEAEIFSVENLSLVLENATPELVPMIVIGAFAGLRTSEILKLDWSEVNLATKQIRVRAEKAKSSKNRWVDMEANLVEWLQPFAGKTGHMWDGSESKFHHSLRPIWQAAGLVKWPRNGGRHSFASYHLASYQNQNQLADILGHTNSQLIFSNYRNLVTHEEGVRYFQIRPPTPVSNVVQISEAA